MFNNVFPISGPSQIKKNLSVSFESGEYNFEAENSAVFFEAIKKKYADGKISLLDGIAVDYPNWRFGLRASNTEPLIRLNVEAYDQLLMKKKLKELIKFIKSYGGKLIEE